MERQSVADLHAQLLSTYAALDASAQTALALRQALTALVDAVLDAPPPGTAHDVPILHLRQALREAMRLLEATEPPLELEP